MGADLDAADEGGGPLHALVDGWIDALWEPMSKEPDRVPPPSPAGVEAVQRMLRAGARVDRTDDSGQTALHRAAGGHPWLVQALIDAGADVEARDEDGNTPWLSAATFNGAMGLACVRVLRSAGADVHAANRQQDNALMFNAAWGYWRMLALLLECGLDVDHRDDLGLTPLHWVARGGYIEALDVLLGAGADPNLCTPQGRTCLMAAAQQGSAAAVSRLLAAGADARARDADDQTALSLAMPYVGVDLEATLIAELRQRPYFPPGARIEVEHSENGAAEPQIEVRYRVGTGGGAGFGPRCDRYSEVVRLLRHAGAGEPLAPE